MLFLAGPVLAHSAALTVPGPERLPEDTWALINWHGVANATKVRGTNPVMRLWNDPQAVAARDQIITQLTEKAGDSTTPEARRAVADDVLSAFENPLVMGIAGDPLAAGKDSVHAYAVINKKGKEASWARLLNQDKPRPNAEVSNHAFNGVQIRKTVITTMPAASANPTAEQPKPKITTSFEATLGDYQLYADDQALMERLITRLNGSASADKTLLQDAAYQRAQRFGTEGALLDVFMKFPDMSRMQIPPNPQVDTAAILRELHPERLQGLWFSAGMGRDRMHVRAALIGDTTPGSLLDLIGGNVKEFQTLAAAPATDSFAAFRLDLPALYATILRAMKAAMPPDKGTAAGMMIDSLAVAQTGLKATELLALFTGEIGVASTGGERLDTFALPSLLMIPVSNGEQVLGLLRKIGGPLFANEEKIASATVLKIGSLPKDPALVDATPPVNVPILLALSPNMLMFSADRPRLEGALSRNAAATSAPTGSLAQDATFRSVRKNFPAELNGISYTDFSRVRWDTYAQAIHQQMDKQRQQILERAARVEKGEGESPPDPAKAAQLRSEADSLNSVEQLLTQILPLSKKYLKISAGGSWKAGDGVFFDSFVN